MRHFSLRWTGAWTCCAHRFVQHHAVYSTHGTRPGMAACFIGLLALGWLSSVQAAAIRGPVAPAATSAPASSTPNADTPVGAGSYYLNVARLDHPLRPFEYLPKSAPIRVRAALVTVPDPVETRLGRSFDIELAALTSAFQASGYVLDGFAFTWIPRTLDKDAVRQARADQNARNLPSVMLFRSDDWRNCSAQSPPGTFCGSTYFVLLLVGETPRSGVHPLAFATAARCAMALDDAGRGRATVHPGDFSGTDCDKLPMRRPTAGGIATPCPHSLDVIGPAFSGSMESMAAALSLTVSGLAHSACARGTPPNRPTAKVRFRMLSPSASVESNSKVGALFKTYLDPAVKGAIEVHMQYFPLAYSVAYQLQHVLAYVGKRSHGPDNKVVVFSEESSFGHGAAVEAKRQEKNHGQLVNVQFPPNIASIRAEHVRGRQARDAQRRQIMPEHLLELDLTGVDQGIDQPPIYQPSLGSRSDELMLYQTFDALNKYVHPAAVIIVATDVRDRLFLLGEIRNALPGALPVVLEQDNLLVHPDYRNASRGSITMPAGRTLVCLPRAYPGEPVVPTPCSGSDVRYFAFATDYAANMFRAVVRLVNLPDIAFTLGPPPEPAILVATLAGFQEAGDTVCSGGQGKCAQRGLLIAADGRLQLQQPAYLALLLFFALALVVLLWLLWNGRKAALVSLPVVRNALRWVRVAPNGLAAPPRMSMAWLGASLVFVLTGVVVASTKVATGFGSTLQRSDYLAHGRDAWTLLGLCLGYACVIAFAALRCQLWNAHCSQLSKAGGNGSRLGGRLGRQGRWWAIIGTMALLLGCVYLSVGDNSPTSVDAWQVSALGALFALGGSTYFLVIFLEGLDRWRRVCLELGKTIRVINAQPKANANVDEWPTPGMLDEPPRTPFNIAMRADNYRAWPMQDSERWVTQTHALLAGQWPFQSGSAAGFTQWQAQLVAEMKLAAAAVRAAAWCSVLGAALALVLIQVYPPVFARLQTTVATILLASGFAAIAYAVIRLEKDRLLGRMFTPNKDQLTVGGALSALWPKLLALGALLVMIFLPDVWDWVGGLAKAVGSFH